MMDYDLFEYSFVNGYIYLKYEQRYAGRFDIYYYDNGAVCYDTYQLSNGMLINKRLICMSTIENIYRFAMSRGVGISLIEGHQVKRSLRCST